MANTRQILNVNIKQYNNILNCLTVPKTILQIQNELKVNKKHIKNYIDKLLQNSCKTGLPMVLKIEANDFKKTNLIQKYVYKRTVDSITLNDLFDNSSIEKAINLLDKRQKKINSNSEIYTTQWRDSEVITVNGMKCCYTVIKNEGYLVHLPGGVKKFAHEMVFSGYEVILPDKLRSE